MSGDQGGLLAKVTAITTSGLQSVLSLSPATLADVFPNVSVQFDGNPQLTSMGKVRRGAIASLRQASLGLDLLIVRPIRARQFRQRTQLHLLGRISKSRRISHTPQVLGNLQTFTFTEDLSLTADLSSGDVSFMQSGAGDFSCSVAGSSLLQPVFAFGPILLNLAADGKFGIAGSESNTSAIDVPAVGYQYTAKENLGLSYTDGSWSTLHKARFSSELCGRIPAHRLRF